MELASHVIINRHPVDHEMFKETPIGVCATFNGSQPAVPAPLTHGATRSPFDRRARLLQERSRYNDQIREVSNVIPAIRVEHNRHQPVRGFHWEIRPLLKGQPIHQHLPLVEHSPWRISSRDVIHVGLLLQLLHGNSRHLEDSRRWEYQALGKVLEAIAAPCEEVQVGPEQAAVGLGALLCKEGLVETVKGECIGAGTHDGVKDIGALVDDGPVFVQEVNRVPSRALA